MACLADACCEIAEHLDLPALLSFGATGRAFHLTTTRVADDRTRRSFQGVWPLPGWGRGPYWKRLGDALRPRRLTFSYCGAPPDSTCLLGAVLSTQSTWFLEFEMTVAKAVNATPCVGLVDARAQLSPGQLKSGKVPRDMSRKGGEELAVSFSPWSGKVFASSLMQSRPMHLGQLPRCCIASLNWSSLDNSSNAQNAPIKAGVLVAGRQLSFYRGSTNGQWRSSGVILRDLPDEVIPAVFMSSFVGFANVSFLNLWPSPPDVECKECDLLGHGLKNDWCSCLESGWCSCSSSKH